MANLQTVLSTYQFKRAGDLIKVFNENSYLMAEYSERTGTVRWQRVLIASQREVIEKWLHERFPIAPAGTASAPNAAKAQVAGNARPASGFDRSQAQPRRQKRASSASAR